MSGVGYPATQALANQGGEQKTKREPEGPRLKNESLNSDHSESMKLRSLSERLGCLSFRTALLSI
jgi:hypothetical protein